MKRLFLSALLCIGLLIPSVIQAGRKTIPVIKDAAFSLERNYSDFTSLPRITLHNKGKDEKIFELSSTLTDTDGRIIRSAKTRLSAPAGGKATVAPFPGESKIRGQVVLFRTDVKGTDGSTHLSGIFGESRPVPRNSANVFGMNVHTSWFDPDVQWELLRMLKAAGITTVREDTTFRDPEDTKGIERTVRQQLETVLAMEAFGIEPLVMIAWFPKGFQNSPQKLERAYKWAEFLAKELKGRVDFHYGNETNSGWGAFGAAADMGPLNAAFALGTKAGDPGAPRASFGIAEGLNNYIREFIKTGVMDHLEALCIHPYCGTPEAGIAKSIAAKELLRKNGSNAQIWATEIGFHFEKDGKLNQQTGELTGVAGYSKQDQENFLPRLYILAQSHGIERIYWYDFFGRNDPETFWIVDENFQPLGAYHALKECSRQLAGTRPAGGTRYDELIQKHLFIRPDGTSLLAVWSTQGERKADFKLPATVRITDKTGKQVRLPADGVLSLNESVCYIEGLPLSRFYRNDVLCNALDKRIFMLPSHRFTLKPGATVEIPWTVFNSSAVPVQARPALLSTNPGWKLEFPANEIVPAHGTRNGRFRLTAPADAVPGTEYEFTFAADLDVIQRTRPYTVRVYVEGAFPYHAIAAHSKTVDYPMWNSMDERQTKKGNPMLTASYGNAVVDGNLSEWKKEEFHPIDQKFQWILRDPGQPSDQDWSGKVAFRWDERNLYAAFLVEDDQLSFLDFSSRDWRESDNMRLFLSSVPDAAKRTKTISRNDLLLIMAPTGKSRTENARLKAAPLGGLPRPGVEKQIPVAARMWKNGYVLEVAVPFSIFNAKPEAGTILGMNVMADDIDDGYRQHVGMTYYANPSYWNSPKALGSLKLVR